MPHCVRDADGTRLFSRRALPSRMLPHVLSASPGSEVFFRAAKACRSRRMLPHGAADACSFVRFFFSLRRRCHVSAALCGSSAWLFSPDRTAHSRHRRFPSPPCGRFGRMLVSLCEKRRKTGPDGPSGSELQRRLSFFLSPRALHPSAPFRTQPPAAALPCAAVSLVRTNRAGSALFSA